jgi:hypothetical protein
MMNAINSRLRRDSFFSWSIKESSIGMRSVVSAIPSNLIQLSFPIALSLEICSKLPEITAVVTIPNIMSFIRVEASVASM